MKRFIVTLLIAGLVPCSPGFSETGPPAPSSRERCPVCGMFVAKYPDWIGTVVFEDGETVYFDGAKDLFKYYFNLSRYAPGKTVKDIRSIQVTEYYDVRPIDARSAWYVIGSDVYGPMGRELVPFETEAEARDFVKDHGGTRTVRFHEVTPALIESLD